MRRAAAGARRIVRFRTRLQDGGFSEPRLAQTAAVAPESSSAAADGDTTWHGLEVLTGDLFRPDTLEPTGEKVDLDVTNNTGPRLSRASDGNEDGARSLHQVMSPLDPPVFLGTGLNYRRHAEECGLAAPTVPILAFVKQSTALQHPGMPVIIPRCCDPAVPEVDWEVELAVVVGRHRRTGALCKDATMDDALDYVLGYTVANDVSARLWQTDPERTGGQWNRGKGFDTFSPLGPALVLNEAGFDPHDLDVSLRVNGETMQASNTSDMIHSVPSIVEFLSRDTTLLPGTVILTGTPEGIGMFMEPPRYLQEGDVVEATIENIGTLTNPVISAPRI